MFDKKPPNLVEVELKVACQPCPFCGNNRRLKMTTEEEYKDAYNKGHLIDMFLGCMKCGFTFWTHPNDKDRYGYRRVMYTMVKKWNALEKKKNYTIDPESELEFQLETKLTKETRSEQARREYQQQREEEKKRRKAEIDRLYRERRKRREEAAAELAITISAKEDEILAKLAAKEEQDETKTDTANAQSATDTED